MKLGKNVLLSVSVLAGTLGVGGPTAHAIISAGDPSDPSLVVWLNARNIDGQNNTTLTDGSLVGSWLNIATGTDSATGTGAQRPTLVTNGFGNRPVLRFDGTANELADTVSGIVTGQGLIIFFLQQQSLAQETLTVSHTGFFGTYNGNLTGYYLDEASNFGFFAGTDNGQPQSGGGSPRSTSGGNSLATVNNPLILAARQDSTTMSLYTNGVQVSSAVSGIIVPGATAFAVGNDGRGAPSGGAYGDGFWTGDFRDVLIYNRALSPSEFASVETFLANEIPEPSTIALFAVGGGWLFLRRRSRSS